MTFKPFSTVGVRRSDLFHEKYLGFDTTFVGGIQGWEGQFLDKLSGIVGDEGSFALETGDDAFLLQLPHGLAQGDAADAVVGGKLGFGWKFIVNLPFLLGDPQNDVIGDLLIGRKGRSAV